MRKCAPFLSLLFGVFAFLPPVYAVNYTGEAWMDWNSLRFSGIPITLKDKEQTGGAFVRSFRSGEVINKGQDGLEWSNSNITSTIPQVATAIRSTDGERLYASVGIFGSGEGGVVMGRAATFTAMDTGRLTISIDYTLQHVGVPTPPGSFSASESVYLHLAGDTFNDSTSRSLSSILSDGKETGILSLTGPYKNGELGFFITEALANGSSGVSVPLPDMLWPTLVGMIGLTFYVERTRRKLAS